MALSMTADEIIIPKRKRGTEREDIEHQRYNLIYKKRQYHYSALALCTQCVCTVLGSKV